MNTMRLLCLAVAALVSGSSVAGTIRLTPQQFRDLMLLNQEVKKQFDAKDYAKAGDACRRIIGILPNDPGPHYGLARALARQGKADEAVSELQASVRLGFKGASRIRKEEDLASLHDDKRFAECLQKVNQAERTGGSAYEAAKEIEGVKTVEGDPEDGFRYRLRMSPKATAAKPNRLMVWLHPANSSSNPTVEALAPRLNGLGCALLVLTQKDWRGWSPFDMDRLVDGTLPDVAKVAGIDAAKPLLMGYNQGGQVALAMWAKTPEKFGGLVLDAASPARPKRGGGIDVMPLPESIGIQQTPIFALVGDQDNNAKVWQQNEASWRQVGVPLTIHYVPGKGQDWLFEEKQLTDLSGWLKQVLAGKLPSGTPAAEPKGKQPPKKTK